MKKKTSLFLAAAMTATLFSCQKDDAPIDGKLNGDYEFVSMTVNGVSTTTQSFEGTAMKSVIEFGYKTKDNAGGISFDGAQAKNTDFKYRIDTVMTFKTWENGVFVDEIEMPFAMSVGPVSNVAKYKLVGNDSIWFEQGLISTPTSPDMPAPTTASGLRYKYDNGVLTFTSKYSITTGPGGQSSSAGSSVIVFRKK